MMMVGKRASSMIGSLNVVSVLLEASMAAETVVVRARNECVACL